MPVLQMKFLLSIVVEIFMILSYPYEKKDTLRIGPKLFQSITSIVSKEKIYIPSMHTKGCGS